MKVELCHTVSTETIELDLPELFVNDLEHVVVISEGEAFQLVSTIPEDVKAKNMVRKEFEDKEFETLRLTYYKDLNEDEDPDKFEQDFNTKVKDVINEKYQSQIDFFTDAVIHTLCVHFVVYAICKNREEKLAEKNEAQKSDKCYAKDYAKRLINLFRILSFNEPGSIRRFSEELNTLEKFMQSDTRRHAGYDKLFAGVHATVTQLANVFITNGTEQKINLVRAFEDVAQGEDNEDRKRLISKISEIIDNTIKYYENYILSIDKTEEDISKINDDISISYIYVGRGLVANFINNTDAFLAIADSGENDAVKIATARKEYKKQFEMFCNYFDDLIAAFDDVTNNTTPDSVFATNLNFIWFNVNKFKSSESETWPIDLAKALFEHYNEIFKDVPITPKTVEKSN